MRAIGSALLPSRYNDLAASCAVMPHQEVGNLGQQPQQRQNGSTAPAPRAVRCVRRWPSGLGGLARRAGVPWTLPQPQQVTFCSGPREAVAPRALRTLAVVSLSGGAARTPRSRESFFSLPLCGLSVLRVVSFCLAGAVRCLSPGHQSP